MKGLILHLRKRGKVMDYVIGNILVETEKNCTEGEQLIALSKAVEAAGKEEKEDA
jgi:hypothetical protein